MASGSKVWTAFSLGAALGSATVAKKALNGGWKAATGKQPPSNPADPDVDFWEAVLWASVSGTFVAVIKMLATRKAANEAKTSSLAQISGALASYSTALSALVSWLNKKQQEARRRAAQARERAMPERVDGVHEHVLADERLGGEHALRIALHLGVAGQHFAARQCAQRQRIGSVDQQDQRMTHDVERKPDAVFVLDTKKEHIAVTEANKLKIPLIAVVDTNCDPDVVNFVIPGNDDAIRSGTLMCRVIADAVEEGRFMASKRPGATPYRRLNAAENAIKRFSYYREGTVFINEDLGRTCSVGGGADANVFNERGLECLNLANGMTDIHTPNEHIAVADLDAMVDVTLALIDAAHA